jgi:hypothetical protein
LSVDPAQVRGFQILQGLVVKALENDAFRQELIDRPTETLKAEGLEVPKDVTVEVLQNTKDKVYLVLPTCPPLLPNELNLRVLFSHHWV